MNSGNHDVFERECFPVKGGKQPGRYRADVRYGEPRPTAVPLSLSHRSADHNLDRSSLAPFISVTLRKTVLKTVDVRPSTRENLNSTDVESGVLGHHGGVHT